MTNRKLTSRVQNLSSRNLGLMVMLCVYAFIAILVADGRFQLVVSALPVVLVAIVTSTTRRASPYMVSLIGIGSFALATLINDISWSPATYLLFVVQIVIVVICGLLMVENQMQRWAGASERPNEGELVPSEAARSAVARELRRSRRMKSPLSLLLVDQSDSISTPERQKMIEFLTSHTREFDIVFELDNNELGILCVNTSPFEATRYVDRLQRSNSRYGYLVATFPDDAVTSQGLIDVARHPDVAKPERDLIATVD